MNRLPDSKRGSLLLECCLITVIVRGGATWQDCVLSDCNVAPGVVIEAGSKRAGEFMTATDDEEDSDGSVGYE